MVGGGVDVDVLVVVLTVGDVVELVVVLAVVVVVTVVEVVTAVVVVVEQTPLLAGVGAARSKSVLSLLVSSMRCRLMVPLPAASGDAAASPVCSVPE